MGANFTPDLQGYTNMKPFKFWCQKVLPTIYDDSLSYYEVLCKLVKYLNTVIENMEKVESNVDALLNAFNLLQGWVNDYFDNLDVQDEIDDKLDRMVEDGTFDRYIQPILDEFEQTVQTISGHAVDEAREEINTIVGQGESAIRDVVILYEQQAHQYVDDAEAWARGTKGGVPVTPQDEQYEDSSKYWAEQAQQAAGGAGGYDEDAEAWAVGTKGGVPVASDEPQYENSSKYWAQQAEQAAQDAEQAAQSVDLKDCCYLVRGITATTYTSSAGQGTIKINSDAWKVYDLAAMTANWKGYFAKLVGTAGTLYDITPAQVVNASPDNTYYIPLFIVTDKAGNRVADNTRIEFVELFIYPPDASTVFDDGVSMTS